jgi:NADH dehydrogenase FAD-containing subunit
MVFDFGDRFQASFFNLKTAQFSTLFLYYFKQATQLRNTISSCFEKADNQRNNGYKDLITFIIIGGDPTGEHKEPALRELINTAISKDYPNAKQTDIKVILIEANQCLLRGFFMNAYEFKNASWPKEI